MNLHLSDWEWLRVVTSLLFIWRGIQDLRDRSGTAWKTEDERKNFRKFSGVTLILGGAAFCSIQFCRTSSRGISFCW